MADEDYLQDYRTNHLYVNPASSCAFTTLVADNETLIGEIEVTDRCKVAVVAFCVDAKKEFHSFRIVKLQYHKVYGWRKDGEIKLSRFRASKIGEFAALISSLDLADSKKARISLGDVRPEVLGTLLRSTASSEILKHLSESPDLKEDIYAVGQKRETLIQFEKMLCSNCIERDWQKFFEANTRIFGYGLQYVFL